MEKGMFKNFIACVTKRYFKFSGRANRYEFWTFLACHILVVTTLKVLDLALGDPTKMTVTSVTLTIYSLFISMPTIAVTARRLHDVNTTGWFQIFPFLALIGAMLLAAAGVGVYTVAGAGLASFGLFIYLIYLEIKKGDEGDNKYGPKPQN